MNMHFIEGGVCAPKDFTANGVLAGIKKGRSLEDTALVFSGSPSCAAGVFTKNRVQAEPVKLCREHLHKAAGENFRAVIINSGNANACTGEEGAAAARAMCEAAAESLERTAAQKSGFKKITKNNILVCSTGVIGQRLPVERISAAAPSLAAGLSKDGNIRARRAILTTDTRYKEAAVETTIGGKAVRIGVMAKGSGMIHINMGTMLGLITSDCAISAPMLQRALQESAEITYNCVSVDGDTSTNDSLLILANAQAENTEIKTEGADYDTFLAALNTVNTKMAREIAADGEGAEHLLECNVSGAKDDAVARSLAKAVISSSLVKAAFFGKDANWGRILCALGYSGEFFTPEKTSVSFANDKGVEKVFERGRPLNFDEEKTKIILSEHEIKILIEMEDGQGQGQAWGCDLSYEYVKINGDYRT